MQAVWSPSVRRKDRSSGIGIKTDRHLTYFDILDFEQNPRQNHVRRRGYFYIFIGVVHSYDRVAQSFHQHCVIRADETILKRFAVSVNYQRRSETSEGCVPATDLCGKLCYR